MVLVDVENSIVESQCTAMKCGLGVNEALEGLELDHVPLLDESAAFRCRAFSFLRTNKTLKSLVVNLTAGATRSCVFAFWGPIAVMLQENASLEIVSFTNIFGRIEAAEYIAPITAFQMIRRSNPSVLMTM
jgi:hypothetical protein